VPLILTNFSCPNEEKQIDNRGRIKAIFIVIEIFYEVYSLVTIAAKVWIFSMEMVFQKRSTWFKS
jgi:hypothetical protein